MIRKIQAWRELLKLGNVKTMRVEIYGFFRENILRVLEKEGWFEYLREPRTAEELAEEFGYTDMDFLNHILDILRDDGLLGTQGERLVLVSQFEKHNYIPRVFTESVINIWRIHADAIPDRLRGKFLDFSGGINLFNWDDALTTKMYEQIRKSAFAYTGALSRTGRFLDVGCGNGYGTAAIWSYYHKKGLTGRNGRHVEITGMDPDENLLEIATEEFPRMVEKHIGEVDGVLERSVLPSFTSGSVEAIPYEDESFDMVYASQVLHWTDAKKAIKEMVRVTKRGGIIFGTQTFYPRANRYNGLHFLVVRGAQGFFAKDDFIQWARDAGASKVSFATPISVFEIVK